MKKLTMIFAALAMTLAMQTGNDFGNAGSDKIPRR